MSALRRAVFVSQLFMSLMAIDSASLTGVTSLPGSLQCASALLAPSASTPTDPNKVRPADIQYIMALGDSITVGACSVNQLGLVDPSPYAGNSFGMGGNGTLADHVTLPNILRTLNPELFGFSVGVGVLDIDNSQLNVAIPGRLSYDLPRQAGDLVNRTKLFFPTAAEQQKFNEGWKLLNLFIGTNDIGLLCTNGVGIPAHTYMDYIKEAIMIIQDNIPRTIISLIGMTNFNFDIMANSIIHDTANLYYCKNGSVLAQPRIEQYRLATRALTHDPELIKEDSVVVAQTIFDTLYQPLTQPDGTYFTDFYAYDSMHLSKFGNSLVAKQLWKQLLTPVYSKVTTNEQLADYSAELACPDEACPYIRTNANSLICL